MTAQTFLRLILVSQAVLALAGCVPTRAYYYVPSAEQSVSYGACGTPAGERVDLLGKRYYLEMNYEGEGAKSLRFSVTVPVGTKLQWADGTATLTRPGAGEPERVPFGRIRNVTNAEIELPLRMDGEQPLGNRLFYLFGIPFEGGKLPDEFDLLLPVIRIDGAEVQLPPFHFQYRRKLQIQPLMC